MGQALRIVVNGLARDVARDPERSLLSVLREELALTGAKPGCGEGACGACTVLLDGQPVRACVTLLEEADGRAIVTVEGVGHADALHPIQRALLSAGAFQCGYCTPGMVVATAALLATTPRPTDDAITTALNGNICRCGTYLRIRRAVANAAEDTGRATSAADSLPTVDLPRPKRPWDLRRPGQREYFELLGDGLAVVLSGAALRRLQAAHGWMTAGGAWLHVGETGNVTAFTGKVDVGQDNRTALSLLVAEELRVPLSAVRLVMGDTDLCPFDEGTFGSRSTVDAGECLRLTAASARQVLVEMAAERWEVAAGDLVAADGVVRSRDGGRAIEYGEIVRGQQRLESRPAAAAETPPSSWQIAGRPTPRLGAIGIVTGTTRYPSDIARPGMLHGRVLRPPAVGATLRSVDLSAAAAIDGVVTVHDGPFVGIVAPDPVTADRAIGAVKAGWRLKTGPSEADLESYLRAHPIESEGWEGAYLEESGDVDRALGAAPTRLSATYTTAYLAHVPLETRVAVAEWDGPRLTVWVGTQVPFGVRSGVAGALGVDEKDVRVIVPATGGGFGGKHAADVAFEAARLARAAGRPVKVRWSRAEEFSWGHLRPAAVIDVRSGADAHGRLTAWEFTNTNSGPMAIESPYEIPNQRIRYQPADSPLPQGSYRALSATANHFARESHMDEVAHRLGVDPLEFRLRHLRDDRLSAVFNLAAERAGWGSRLPGGHGLGIAGGVEKGAYVATCATVRVDAEGRLEVLRLVTAFDCGAIVNPENLVNQIEGATVMGLGGALFEAVHFDDGRLTNGSMSAYRVPRFSDVPPIEVVLLDRKDVPSAGAGETPIVAVAPALANAIFAATGRRLRSMPMLPDDVVPRRS